MADRPNSYWAIVDVGIAEFKQYTGLRKAFLGTISQYELNDCTMAH